MRTEKSIQAKKDSIDYFLEKSLFPSYERRYWEGYQSGLEFALNTDKELLGESNE